MSDNLMVALAKVIDPELRRSITELGMVESAEIKKGAAKIKILLTIAACPMRDKLNFDIDAAARSVEGVSDVKIEFGAMTQEQRDSVKKLIRGGKEAFIPFAQPGSLTRVIGVASGKGGVGKSSLTVNLAIAAAKQGLNVGILDADVYGHSVPRLMGIVGQRPTAIDQTFIPIEAFGVKVVSMEMFKSDRSDPVAYRGPLLHKVLEQLLSDAYWGDLDLLFLDLPPGTGDIAISLGQLIPASEILVVTTPQIAAAEVAERAGRIAHQLKQHIIGVVENMSDMNCPKCGEKISLFGNGGGKESAARLSKLVGYEVSEIASVPFTPQLREGGDNGNPIVISDPSSDASKAIFDLTLKIAKRSQSIVGRRLPLS
jgi:ATP-binding protein involved in chromosome partitioning